MFIYILNLLNDSLRKNKIHTLPAFEIMSDTTYVSKLAGIKRNFDFKSFSDKIIDIFYVFDKYRLPLMDSMEILNKIILNDHNLWILENIYKEIGINSKDEFKTYLGYIINSILEKYRIEEEWMNRKQLAL